MKRSKLAVGEVKAVQDDAGTFEAYVSVFGNVDSVGDVVERGAFAKTLAEWAERGRHVPVYYGHRTDDPDMCVGHVVEAVEDEHGLKASVQIDMDGPKGAQTFRLVKDGRIGECSFGYVVRESERENGHNVLKELELLEVSVVPVGANRATSISNVKGGGESVTEQSKGDDMQVKINNRDERAEAKTKADELVAQAKAGELNDEGKAELAGLVEAVQEFDAKAAKALESKALIDAVAALGGEPVQDEDGEKAAPVAGRKFLAFSGRKSQAVASKAAKAMLGGIGTKALVSSGSSVVGVPLEDQSPIEQQRIPTSFLDVLPTKQHTSPTYRYLRQTVRDLQAAAWQSGQKATSAVSVESVDGELRVIAHISEGVPEYENYDNAELSAFVEAEMRYGLRQAVEAEVLAGDGTGASMTGILNTSGVQAQAFDTDPITTARKAITVMEAAGYVPHVFVIRPETAEAISLQRNTSGQLDMGNVAVDRAAQRLHGVPYVVSTALPTGKAVLLDQSAVRVDYDAAGVRVKWGTQGDDFGSNLIRLRSELRAGVSVLRAGGVVVLDTVSV
ncbi:HK97 family phage prohead protease [Gordonia sp. NPDC062954]|uniref:HK97 family phage prohead protease n=1 Tax=Gordonia sp. NPDC062954 TaxID=3364003 RepID=UPI0037C86F4E